MLRAFDHMRAWWQVMTCLGMTRMELSRAMRPSPWAAFRGRLALWLSFFWASALAMFALYVAWQNSSPSAWIPFWGFAGFATVLSCVALPAGSPGAMVVPVRYPRDIVALRAAAASGDAAVAPPSPLQLGVPDGAHPIPACAWIRPLYRPEAIFNSWNMGTAMVMATVFGVEQILSPYLPYTIPVWSHVFPFLGGVLISLGVFYAARLFLLLRGFSVDTDEEGLAWHERGRLQWASWQDIRSLSVIELPEFGGLLRHPPRRRVYVLDAGDASLIWTPSRGGRPRRRGANPSLLLCNLVVARTGLSLRDLTSEAVTVVEARQQMSSRAAWREWLSSVVGDAPSAVQRRLRIALLYVPFALAALLMLSLLLAGFAVARLQPGAYADQLAAARASTPLLHDPLSENTGLWAVTPDGSQTFAGGAYVLNAQRGRREIHAWTPDTFADVMLEITMRNTTSFDLDQAGLILRADDASQTMLLFTITPSGKWQLRRLGLDGYASHNWRSIERTLVDEGNTYSPVGAIHQGLDATNHLAVLMRGNAYAFFINDQYVGAYRDDGGPTSGHVGMFVDIFGGTASYTDLAIYPAPPSTLLAPI